MYSINKFYQDNGYITGRSHNDCHASGNWLTEEDDNDTLNVAFDHDGSAFACDPFLETYKKLKND